MKHLFFYRLLRPYAAVVALGLLVGTPYAASADVLDPRPPLASFVDPTDPDSPSPEELEALIRALAAAGAAEVATPPAELRTGTGFSERLRTALELDRAHTSGRLESSGADAGTFRLLDLITAAGTYSEARLLAQTAFGSGRQVENLTLTDFPDDLDWVFDGYNVQLPEIVSLGLEVRREARDNQLETLSEDAFREYAEAVETVHRSQRAGLAAVAGRAVDLRQDLYVVELENGQVWRRKLPSGGTLITTDQGEPGGDWGLEKGWTELDDEAESLANPKAIFGADGRMLRSRFNGFNMNSTVWKPKGAIISRFSSPNAVPIAVNCTGVKITERLVVTAGHCLFRNGSWNSNRRWIPGADGIAVAMGLTSDPSPFGYKKSYRRIVRSQWKDHEWKNFDFGLMVLYDNLSSCQLPWHGWKRERRLFNDRVHLYGFPGAREDCAASPLSNGDCYGSIYGASGRILYAGAYRVHYKIDTQGGQSGTGFYKIDNGSRKVVGVHRGKLNRFRNDGVRINRGVRNIINRAKSDYPPNACR